MSWLEHIGHAHAQTRPSPAALAEAQNPQRRPQTLRPSMDWFQHLTGFTETEAAVRRHLSLRDGRLHSSANGRHYGAGTLLTPRLAELRASPPVERGHSRVRVQVGDARALHARPAHAGALFQVASQFNLLEMVGPDVTPGQGVTRYAHDRTQGPACAMAAGAGTIYRNWFAAVGDQVGQAGPRQLDMLADLGEALAAAIGCAPEPPWAMRNGYALPTAAQLAQIDAHLAGLDEPALDALRSRLRIGWHRDVEVTDAATPSSAGPRVSQAYCSAMPVAYSPLPSQAFARLATLVLEAAYEATLRAAAQAVAEGAPPQVLLTRLGGGVFGNDGAWIDTALHRALRLARPWGLDVILVCWSGPHPSMQALAQAHDPGD